MNECTLLNNVVGLGLSTRQVFCGFVDYQNSEGYEESVGSVVISVDAS